MLTDFEFFIATLPDWDGKDRVTELERLVKMQLVVYAGGGVGTSPVKRLIIEVIRKNTNIMFCGKQGIGKSTFARWLYPFEQEEMIQRWKDVEIVSLPNNSLIMETTLDEPLYFGRTSYCYLGEIDYTYTGIDIKQLYTQVLAEQKE